ncbi:unnamed protein product [Pedinophyceae sp. YPF-701]|nr:unnamed protein product [Pedinophyceae sp. YPF-701]
MLVEKKVRVAIYKFLFREGVCTAEKDFNTTHPEITVGEGENARAVRNLHVIKLMQSLRSRELVKEQYAWRHYYWFLTDAGIAYMREYLNIPEEVIPNTLVKVNRPMERRAMDDRGPRGDGPRGPRGGDRDGYRARGPGGPGGPPKDSAPAGFAPSYGQ